MKRAIIGIATMRYPNEEEVKTYKIYSVDESEPFEIEGQRCVVNEYGDATFVEVFNEGMAVFTIQADLVKYIRRADDNSAE